MNTVNKLISIGSYSLIADAPDNSVRFSEYGSLGLELKQFLTLKNGFYAFEAALHVFPCGNFASGSTLASWNFGSSWRSEYGEMAKGFLFFAETLFGDQFGIKDNAIYLFEAETGATNYFAATLADWASKILEDYNFITGYSLGHEWQTLNGELPIGKRLGARFPFVFNGAFAIDNLYCLDANSLLKALGGIARQIKDVPDGMPVEIKGLQYPGK